MNIGIIHYIYLIIILIIISLMVFRKSVVLPSIIGVFIIGYLYSGSLINSIQIIYKAIYVSANELIDVIVMISLLNAMAKVLGEVNSDKIIMKPISKIMTNKTTAFLGVGFIMLIFSWIMWPTPAAAFLGVLILRPAMKAGLDPIWVAVAMNIFGNGAALSSDYFIQAAPAITAKTASLKSQDIVKASISFWLCITIVTAMVSYLLMIRDTKANLIVKDTENTEISEFSGNSKLIAIMVPILFISDLIFMFLYSIKGKEASYLIGGTAVIILCIATVLNYGFSKSLGEITRLIKDGFIFGIRFFSPIILIVAFFFLGSKDTAVKILGGDAQGLLAEIGLYIANEIKLGKAGAIILQALISCFIGIGGSGFSGLPLVGTLAEVFSSSTGVDKAALAALGQILTIWVGGGTLMPWTVATVAAVCNVDEFELVKKNIIPVVSGIIFTIILAILIL